MTPRLELRQVVKQFGPRHARHTALHELTADVDSSTRLGIVGESGSGKSTLARLLVGLESPTSGEVYFDGVPVRQLLANRVGRLAFRKNVQYVAQDSSSSFDPRHTLLAAVTAPAMILESLSKDEAVERARETFEMLELPWSVANRYPGGVSGGQRQRISLARSLVVRPRILITDEVVSALDVSVQGSVLNLIKDYCASAQAGLVFVSHGLPATAFIADELLVLYRGTVVERGAVSRVVDHPTHSYTRMLINAYRGDLTPAEETEALA